MTNFELSPAFGNRRCCHARAWRKNGEAERAFRPLLSFCSLLGVALGLFFSALRLFFGGLLLRLLDPLLRLLDLGRRLGAGAGRGRGVDSMARTGHLAEYGPLSPIPARFHWVATPQIIMVLAPLRFEHLKLAKIVRVVSLPFGQALGIGGDFGWSGEVTTNDYSSPVEIGPGLHGDPILGTAMRPRELLLRAALLRFASPDHDDQQDG